jgi:hypothetical protein
MPCADLYPPHALTAAEATRRGLNRYVAESYYIKTTEAGQSCNQIGVSLNMMAGHTITVFAT